MKDQFSYYQVGQGWTRGIYRFPKTKNRRKQRGSYWNGTEWILGIARNVQHGREIARSCGTFMRSLNVRRAQLLIYKITKR